MRLSENRQWTIYLTTTLSPVFELVGAAPTGGGCGERVVWHEVHGAVYWTDTDRFLIHCFTPRDGTVRSGLFDEPVTALILTDRNHLLAIGLVSQISLWEPSSERRRTELFRLPSWPNLQHDAPADTRGSLRVGSMRNRVLPNGRSLEAGGNDDVLCRVEPDGRASEHRSGIGVSNIIAESPDQGISILAIRSRTQSRSSITRATVPAADDTCSRYKLGGSLYALRTVIPGQPESRFLPWITNLPLIPKREIAASDRLFSATVLERIINITMERAG